MSAHVGTVCSSCGCPHGAASRLCPLCPADLGAFGLAMIVAGLAAAWNEADELAGRMEFEANQLRASVRGKAAA